MYVVTLIYKQPLEEVDKHRQAHLGWVRHQYEAGHFIASGACMPRTGGVILARSMSREDLDTLLAEDPFKQRDMADYQITFFKVTSAAPGLQELLEA